MIEPTEILKLRENFLKWHHLYIVTLHQLKLSLEFHNGKNKYFYPRAPASASDDNSELKYSNRINDRDIIQHVLMVKNKTPERKGGSIPEALLPFESV